MKLLVGPDVLAAHNRIEARFPEHGHRGPTALLTPFGWSLFGPTNSISEDAQEAATGHVHSIHVVEEDENLRTCIERLWTTEAFGIIPTVKPILSQVNQRAINILEATLQWKNNRYEFGLMWKNQYPVMPNNREATLRRLYSLENRFRRDPNFASRYGAVVDEYIQLGHARLSSTEEVRHPPAWENYLAHHAPVNPNKPDKVRVVFDASAKFQGTSLNQNLLKGPDLLTSMIGVTLRFREKRIPILADIEKMYHQVKVRSEDQPALRFLWRPPGCLLPPLTYQMTVHVFGAVSSPTTCLYALLRTAEDHKYQFPQVADLVKSRFYVDNYMDSTDTEEEAVQRVHQLTSLLQLGGFRLTKWLSSSRTVLAAIDKKELACPTIDLNLDPLPVERTLGLRWNSETDTISFRSSSLSIQANTHRQILKEVASIFDPVGFLAAFTITAKILLQDIWRSKVEWDDTIPANLLTTWKTWASQLQHLENIKIPRCLHSLSDCPIRYRLHVFSDASQRSFGAVAYLRTEYSTASTALSFVMAKFRVSPLKQLSIPRLELQGAVLAFRLASTISIELQLPLNDATFWIDSLTSLQWIQSESQRYHAFVAHRVGAILSETKRKQWRHVPGPLNPADDGSRGVPASQISNDHRWLAGPEFLLNDPNCWPAPESIEPDQDDPEVIPETIIAFISTEPSQIRLFFDRTSTFTRIKRVVGWILRFIHNCRRRIAKNATTTGELTADELTQSLTTCIKLAQQDDFPLELHQLKKVKSVHPTSRVRKLGPFIDAVGVMRVGGRLEKSSLNHGAKHQMILSADHPLSRAIIWHHHQDGYVKNSHLVSERLLADIRQQFWILGGKNSLKPVINKCFRCKRLRGRPQSQFMAPLPGFRLQTNLPPFSNIGVDYAGPFYVTIGRRTEKRWMCLFTCLIVRAVHLEVAHHMDTDSFLMCFQRFTSSRRHPLAVFSDNGTNFVGAERELREAVTKLNSTVIQKELAAKNIEWHFNPPLAPHHGGSWERQRINQSTKKCF